jgi:hypothetical protein
VRVQQLAHQPPLLQSLGGAPGDHPPRPQQRLGLVAREVHREDHVALQGGQRAHAAIPVDEDEAAVGDAKHQHGVTLPLGRERRRVPRRLRRRRCHVSGGTAVRLGRFEP